MEVPADSLAAMPSPAAKKKPNGKLAALHAAAPEKKPMHWIPIDRYYRSATLLQRQAEAYRRSGNPEQLYVILLRFANLALKTIPRHSAYDSKAPEAMRLRRMCCAAVTELEGLQSELRKTDSLQMLEERPFKSITAPPEAVKMSAGHVPGLHWAGAEDAAAAGASVVNADLSHALEGLGRPGWMPDGNGGQSINKTADLAVTLPSMPDLTPSVVLPQASQSTLSKHAIMPLDLSLRRDVDSVDQGGAVASSQSTYSALLSSLRTDASSALSTVPPPSPYDSHLQLGPQEIRVHSAVHPVAPPSGNLASCSEVRSDSAPGSIAKIDTDIFTAAPPETTVSEIKSRKSMRDVHVSKALMDEFLRYAAENTRRSVETCGILAGILSPDDSRFTVAALIVPKQEGTTDTVQALSEEEIFDVQDSRGLYPLGWIHTHPSQSCFLSSIDVHTHCGYQTMLDEAIAIVMAPTDVRTPVGIFRLTTPGGLQLVQKCPHRGFHMHPPTETGQELYELCGHVYLNPRVDFEVIDLRHK